MHDKKLETQVYTEALSDPLVQIPAHDAIVRVAVGIEDAGDLIADFEGALAAVEAVERVPAQGVPA